MIRLASPDELGTIYQPQPGYETVCFVNEDAGAINGHVCISRAMGQVFGHNMEVKSEDATVALRLWRAARTLAKEWGASSVLVHFDRADHPMIPFWEGRGFQQRFTVYEGAI